MVDGMGPVRRISEDLEALVSSITSRCPVRPELEKEEDDRPTTPLQRFINQTPHRLRHATFDNFSILEPMAAQVVERIKEHVAWMITNKKTRGILIYGPPGTGKDHLLTAAGKVLAEQGVNIGRTCGADLFRRFRDCQWSKDEEELIRILMRPDILIISDPVLNGVITQTQQQQLYLVIDSRWSEDKPCWVSVNARTATELENLLGGQIVDRLNDGSLVLQTTWQSFRKPVGRRK